VPSAKLEILTEAELVATTVVVSRVQSKTASRYTLSAASFPASETNAWHHDFLGSSLRGAQHPTNEEVDGVAHHNARIQAELLSEASPPLKDLIQAKPPKLIIVSGMYNIRARRRLLSVVIRRGEVRPRVDLGSARPPLGLNARKM
jgi:hypothetical protein